MISYRPGEEEARLGGYVRRQIPFRHLPEDICGTMARSWRILGCKERERLGGVMVGIESIKGSERKTMNFVRG